MATNNIFGSFFILLALVNVALTASLPQNKLDDALTQKERSYFGPKKANPGSYRVKLLDNELPADRDSKILRSPQQESRIRKISQASDSQIVNVLSMNGKKGGPKRKRPASKKPVESKIIYIRLPPAPYMMVPGLGYVSKPEKINPLAIFGSSTSSPMNTHQIRKKHPLPDSPIIRIPGKFAFNGKPSKQVYTLPQRKRSSRTPSLWAKN